MKRTWLGFIVEFLEEHFFLNEFFDPDKLPGNRFYNDFADLVDKRAQIIFPGWYNSQSMTHRLWLIAMKALI